MTKLTIFLFISVFILINIYPIYSLSHWLKPNYSKLKILLFSLICAILFFLLVYYARSNSLTLLRLSYYYFGFILFLIPIVFVWQIAYLVGFRKIIKKQYFAYSAISLALIVSVISAVNYLKPLHINYFTIHSNKISKPYNVVHITDTQYGTANKKELKNLENSVYKINQKYPINAIVFTGDAIDTHLFSQDDLKPLEFAKLSPKTQKLFSLGNHEFYHDYSKILKVINNLGYKILRNQKTYDKEINFVGIDDPTFVEKEDIPKILQKTLPKLTEQDKFNVFLYHRPSGVDVAKNNEIDLMLTGHTHGGQFFPYTLIVQSLNQYTFGLVQIDNFHLYNSDGVSLWGPRMRLGTKNEIAVFRILPS